MIDIGPECYYHYYNWIKILEKYLDVQKRAILLTSSETEQKKKN